MRSNLVSQSLVPEPVFRDVDFFGMEVMLLSVAWPIFKLGRA